MLKNGYYKMIIYFYNDKNNKMASDLFTIVKLPKKLLKKENDIYSDKNKIIRIRIKSINSPFNSY